MAKRIARRDQLNDFVKRQFALDDEALEELKEQLIDAEEVAADKDGKMLVWTGAGETPPEETVAPTADAPAAEPALLAG